MAACRATPASRPGHPRLQELLLAQQVQRLLYGAAAAAETPHELLLLGQGLAGRGGAVLNVLAQRVGHQAVAGGLPGVVPVGPR